MTAAVELLPAGLLVAIQHHPEKRAGDFMVRITATLVAFVTLCAMLEGQTAVLKGLVVSDELGGPPVAGVEIATADGEARAVTDAAGSFTLLFPDRHAGDIVKLSVRREGREVVN